MKHAGPAALARLAPLLDGLRGVPGLTERRPGCFYRGAVAFLHFHEDPAGLFADAKLDGPAFGRWPVDREEDWAALLARVRARVEQVSPSR